MNKLSLGVHFNRSDYIDKLTFDKFLNASSISCIAFFVSLINVFNPNEYVDKLNFFPHGNMRINLSSTKQNIRDYSISVISKECSILKSFNINNIVVHPGSTTNLCTNEEGLRLLADSLNTLTKLHPNVNILVENMAGAGGQLCSDLNDFKLLSNYVNSSNIHVCLDTCHAFAYGYNLHNLNELKTIIEFIRNYFALKLIHFNDSKHILGSKKDRHANWGTGYLTKLNFLFNCLPWLQQEGIPLVLETNGGTIEWITEIDFIYDYKEKKPIN